jgi:hypothetical protein
MEFCGPQAENKGIEQFGQPEQKNERRSVTSQAPPVLPQRKPYLTGSPPSRQERRYRQDMSSDPIITRESGECQSKPFLNLRVWARESQLPIHKLISGPLKRAAAGTPAATSTIRRFSRTNSLSELPTSSTPKGSLLRPSKGIT